MNKNMISIIIVLLIILVPGVIGYIFFSLGLLEGISKIIAYAMIIFPICFIFYVVRKMVKKTDLEFLIKAFLYSGFGAFIIYLISGKIGLFVAAYLIPLSVNAFINAKITELE